MDRLNALLVVLALSAGANLVVGADLRSSARLPVGERIAVEVSSPQFGPTPLSDVGAGTCRYVVVYSPTCHGSAALSHQWQQDMASDPIPLPEGWTAIWLSSTTADSVGTFQPPRDPVIAAHTHRLGDWVQAAGINSSPYVLILDKQGRVIAGKPGGRLEPMRSYTDRCVVSTF